MTVRFRANCWPESRPPTHERKGIELSGSSLWGRFARPVGRTHGSYRVVSPFPIPTGTIQNPQTLTLKSGQVENASGLNSPNRWPSIYVGEASDIRSLRTRELSGCSVASDGQGSRRDPSPRPRGDQPVWRQPHAIRSCTPVVSVVVAMDSWFPHLGPHLE